MLTAFKPPLDVNVGRSPVIKTVSVGEVRELVAEIERVADCSDRSAQIVGRSVGRSGRHRAVNKSALCSNTHAHTHTHTHTHRRTTTGTKALYSLHSVLQWFIVVESHRSA